MDMSLLGIIVALVVLIIICYRKFNPVVGTLICVAILAIFSGLSKQLIKKVLCVYR